MITIKEFWLDTKADPDYEVSNTGIVRNKKTGRVLTPQINREGGYYRVALNGKKQYVHRLVADAFYDGDHSHMDVNHLDGNPANNQLSNLEWCTRKENLYHASENDFYHTKLTRITPCKHCIYRGEFDICADKPDDFYCSYGKHGQKDL